MNPFSENAQKCPEGNTKSSGRHRAWCGTTNNYTKEIDWSQIQQLGDYGCVAEEVAPNTGTPHLQ